MILSLFSEIDAGPSQMFIKQTLEYAFRTLWPNESPIRVMVHGNEAFQERIKGWSSRILFCQFVESPQNSPRNQSPRETVTP
jgi:hypothetical protein